MANPPKRTTGPFSTQIHPPPSLSEADLVDITIDTLDAATKAPPGAESTEPEPSNATTDATHTQTPSRGPSTVSGSSRSDASRTNWTVIPDPLRSNPLGCQQRNRPFCYTPTKSPASPSSPANPSHQFSSFGSKAPPDHAPEGQPSSSTTPASPHQSPVHTATKGYVPLSPLVAARSSGSGVARSETRLNGRADARSCK